MNKTPETFGAAEDLGAQALKKFEGKPGIEALRFLKANGLNREGPFNTWIMKAAKGLDEQETDAATLLRQFTADVLIQEMPRSKTTNEPYTVESLAGLLANGGVQATAKKNSETQTINMHMGNVHDNIFGDQLADTIHEFKMSDTIPPTKEVVDHAKDQTSIWHPSAKSDDRHADDSVVKLAI